MLCVQGAMQVDATMGSAERDDTMHCGRSSKAQQGCPHTHLYSTHEGLRSVPVAVDKMTTWTSR